MLCDELKVYVPQDGPYGLEPEEGGKLVEEETCYLKSEVDAAIAELKDKCQMHDFFWEGCGFAKRGFKNAIAVAQYVEDLEAENERLRGESCKLTDGCLRLKQCRKEKANIADKLRHSNHKRCLAMAKWCEAEVQNCLTQQRALICFPNTDRFQYLQGHFLHFSRWHRRWLALAEEPTWAKFLQLIRKEAK